MLSLERIRKCGKTNPAYEFWPTILGLRSRDFSVEMHRVLPKIISNFFPERLPPPLLKPAAHPRPAELAARAAATRRLHLVAERDAHLVESWLVRSVHRPSQLGILRHHH